jgi:ribosomal protein S18 acetylase RimI-like enzyme
MDESEIAFTSAGEESFEDFKNLRKSVMRAHVKRQGLEWDEVKEDKHHRELFDQEELRMIMHKGKRAGYVGVSYDAQKDRVVLGRFCLAAEYQGRGIGSTVMRKILSEAVWRGRTVFLEVLLKNPASRLYERMGFNRIGEDSELAYYEKLVEDAGPRPDDSF